jgi:hypothetical protein
VVLLDRRGSSPVTSLPGDGSPTSGGQHGARHSVLIGTGSKKCSELHRMRTPIGFYGIGHRARCLVKAEKGASPSRAARWLCRATSQVARNSRLEALAEPPGMAKPKTPAAGSASGERDSLVRTSKFFLTFPSRERIDSAFVGALAHFLFPSSATEWQSVRVVFGNIRHVHMPADCAADALSGEL